MNNVLKAYAGKNKHHWATFAKLAQWSMCSTPRKDRGNKSPYEIVTGLKPHGPLDAVFERFSPESLTAPKSQEAPLDLNLVPPWVHIQA